MMKETTYTPKRLLSLILALVMLLGMLPTAVGAEKITTSPVGFTSNAGGLQFQLWAEADSDGPYFVGKSVDTTLYYKILAYGNTRVKGISERVFTVTSSTVNAVGLGTFTVPAVSAEDSSVADKVEELGGTKVFKTGAVIAEGSLSVDNRIIVESTKNPGTANLEFYVPLNGYTWTLSDGTTHTHETNVTTSVVLRLPLGYAVSFATGSTADDVTGMPETVYAATAVNGDVYSCEIPEVKPERKGYEFAYWKTADGTIVRPGDTLEVTAATELTAEWKESVSGTHVVTFDVGAGAQVTGVTYDTESTNQVTVAEGEVDLVLRDGGGWV